MRKLVSARVWYRIPPLPLTDRQNFFVLEYLQDLNATKAAERAGYRHPNVQGSQLMAKPNIQTAITHEIDQRSERLRCDSDWVVERLEQEAVDPENPASTRVRALELIGKHLGIFVPEKAEVTYSGSLFAEL